MKYITYYELLKMIKDDYEYDTNKAPKKVVFKEKTYKKYLDNDGVAYYGNGLNEYLIDDISKEKTEDDIITEYSIAIKIEEEFEDIEYIETIVGGDCKHRIFESNGTDYEVSPKLEKITNKLIKNQNKIIEILKSDKNE